MPKARMRTLYRASWDGHGPVPELDTFCAPCVQEAQDRAKWAARCVERGHEPPHVTHYAPERVFLVGAVPTCGSGLHH